MVIRPCLNFYYFNKHSDGMWLRDITNSKNEHKEK
jgi:hypothetical protein